MLSASTPKATAFSTFEDTAITCLLKSFCGIAFSNQLLADNAFSKVSVVLNDFDEIRISVLAGIKPCKTVSRSRGSIFATKCTRGPWVAMLLRALHTILGPRSEPPIPIFTTSVISVSLLPRQLLLRRFSASALIFCCVSLTSARVCALSGRRKAVWCAARASVLLTSSPAMSC